MRATRILLSLILTAGCVTMSLSAAAAKGISAEESEKTLKVADGLECKLWASEPNVINPTSMDIDEKGRVWVAEGCNYRNKKNMRPEGDCIVILEDTKGAGVCDKRTVFWQSKDLICPLGVSVIGNKVYVSQSPKMMVFTIDETGYKPKGEPEIFFNGFSGYNHDHGLHKAMVGPDGRMYFNSGNAGLDGGSNIGKPADWVADGVIKNAKGELVVDTTGSQIGPKGKVWHGGEKAKGAGYREGMAFRVNLDGSGFETLGHDFRNNYEVTVDSFGTVWQSDNDDDGNQGVRLNFVMEGGDFGYAGWGKEKKRYPTQSAQEAHWRQREPGVVPNLYVTGGGSPTGILVYEGDLLPAKYQGALIHCNAGGQWYSYVGAFMTKENGAGFKCVLDELVKADDKWFKPSAVNVAPDGAVMIADWYDGQSGGHGMQDDIAGGQKGRIFRLAPKGNKPSVPALDAATVDGQIAALCSPNLATRYVGYSKLTTGGAPAIEALKKLYTTTAKPALKARALWALAKTEAGKDAVTEALKDSSPDIRVTAIRAARQIKLDMVAIANQLKGDAAYSVLRELAIAMLYEPTEKAVPVLVDLTDRINPTMPEAPVYDPNKHNASRDDLAKNELERQDRVTNKWYIEAVGIGATGREKELLEAWSKNHKNNDPKLAEVVTWRLNKVLPELPKAEPSAEPKKEKKK
ncbi:MAG: PVC-type heme-binding CxxCH protein [Planctomycetota bacterium]